MKRLAAFFGAVALPLTLAAALDTFDGDLSAYTKAGTGTWYLDNGRLAHTYSDSTGDVEIVRAVDVPRADADVTLSSGRSSAGLTVLWKDHRNHLWTRLEVSPANPTGVFSIGRRLKGNVASLLATTYGGLVAGATYHLTLSVTNGVATAHAVFTAGSYDRTLTYTLTSADRSGFGGGTKAGARARYLSNADDGGSRWDNLLVGTPSSPSVSPSPSPSVSPSPTTSPSATGSPPVAAPLRFVAAGDVCGKATPDSCKGSGALIQALGADLALTLGDNQYDLGGYDLFTTIFDLSPWGAAKQAGILRPAIGNHEYLTASAAGYAQYFGLASPFYSTFEAAGVRFFNIDSNVGVDPTSEQYLWLTSQLAANTDPCVVAYWHHPLFTSGAKHPPSTWMQPTWDLLAANGGDLVLNGHSHNYERFAPIGGMTEYVVGTGMWGTGYAFNATPDPSSLVRLNGQGILSVSVDPVAGTWTTAFTRPDLSVADTGSGTC